MIGTLPTGTIQNVHIQAVAHEGLTVTANGKAAKLAIIDEDGRIIAAGAQVAQEAEAVAINCFKALMRGQGHLRTLSNPIIA